MNNEPWFVHLRKDKFDEVGVTLPLQDLRRDDGAASQKVNKPDKNFFAFDGQMTEADWTGNGLPWMWMFGGRLFDKEGNPTINTPQNIAGVQAYTDLFKNKMMPPGVVSQQVVGQQRGVALRSGGRASPTRAASCWRCARTTRISSPTRICRRGHRKSNPARLWRTAGSAALVINKKSQAIDESMQVARMILSPDRYPTQFEKAGSYWFPIMKNYLTLPFFTQDQWNKEVTENIVP